MSRLSRLSAVALLPVAIATGFASFTGPLSAPAQAGGSSDAQCEVRASKRGGSTTLEGFVTTGQPIAGSYRLSVATSGGGGGSDIDQSGAFSSKSGSPASLGVVTLGGSGHYSATLTVKSAGGGVICTTGASN